MKINKQQSTALGARRREKNGYPILCSQSTSPGKFGIERLNHSKEQQQINEKENDRRRSKKRSQTPVLHCKPRKAKTKSTIPSFPSVLAPAISIALLSSWLGYPAICSFGAAHRIELP